MVQSDPLSVERWLQEGFAVLTTESHVGLRAAPLAKRLGVSRGSFYWHFEDLSSFHEALLRHWVETAVYRPLAAAVTRGGTSAARLSELIDIAFNAAPALERAIQAWSAVDPKVSKAVAEVTALRMAHLRRMLEDVGFDSVEAETRSTVIYWAFLGRYIVPDLPGEDGCIALIRGLATKVP